MGGGIKFQSGGAIVPKGCLTLANFINVADFIESSNGGGSTPPLPYPQGPHVNGTLIMGGTDWTSGNFFTGYWLTLDQKELSLKDGIIVGGWYTNTTDFALSEKSSGIRITPILCLP